MTARSLVAITLSLDNQSVVSGLVSWAIYSFKSKHTPSVNLGLADLHYPNNRDAQLFPELIFAKEAEPFPFGMVSHGSTARETFPCTDPLPRTRLGRQQVTFLQSSV